MRYAPALSVSRINDFFSCPLKFRYRVIDRIPEPPAPAAVRGTLVHAVLENLYDLPAQDRTPEAAEALIDPAWQALVDKDPKLEEIFLTEDRAAWMSKVASLVRAYFRQENPTRLNPAAENRERMITEVLPSGLRFRGAVDRIDVAGDGAIRIIDYKTGRKPHPRYQGEAIFQLRAYALLISLAEGRMPDLGHLIYLGSNETFPYRYGPADTQRALGRIDGAWSAISDCLEAGKFRPTTSKLCDWCSFQDRCPAFGGSEPEMSASGAERLRKVAVSA
ncbi:MAG: PD-(D/E)XK nuclease family protein [Flaviflexus sp.]|nr:PD-(D/E)XK nuclease family protein [Flaviflexus sp.]